MSSKDAHLYGVPRPKKLGTGKEITASSTLAFNSALSSLLAGSTSSTPTVTPGSNAASGARQRIKPRDRDDIFATHNRNAKKRAAADVAAQAEEAARHRDARMDEATWRRTRRKMEEKSRLYAAMKRGEVEDEGERHMVDFDRKWAERDGEGGAADDAETSSDDSGAPSDGEPEELVEYEDEYGRTRRGTRAEAAREERRRQMGERHAREADRFAARPEAPSGIIYGDTVQAGAFDPDEPVAAQMEELAAKRDRELTPPEAVHYDADREVRNKGTGFFHFSKDEAERQGQLRDLEAERLETERVRAAKGLDARKEERRRALEARRQLINKKKDDKQAKDFLDELGEQLATAEDEGETELRP